eukprot:CAMPEP_0202350998 /NCGR_PEP_ID=MMETSP1126-20121109/7833_1 /ASSEMBLY_ACC=CAM_ASM_000457 /TAXON_ID=3047 /ORGANISM="Dunaliella tertiolecta, Strain CCMP1320" /LENGTH=77 /DNA_ID=CAMNT_0048943055 /DNA_START=70 /DNA_END=302 /DNA_ORIENTATION=+
MKLEEGAGENFISLKVMLDLWTHRNMTRVDTKKEAPQQQQMMQQRPSCSSNGNGSQLENANIAFANIIAERERFECV